jgi:CRISPR system Cascade subunit CasE
MHLSQLMVNIGDNPDRPRPGRLWLRNVYRVHQRLCMAFPSSEQTASDPQFLKPYSEDKFPLTKASSDGEEAGDVHQPRSDENGFLFRIDPRPGNDPRTGQHDSGEGVAIGPRPDANPVILVLSAKEPNWDYAFQNADYLLAAPHKAREWEFSPKLDELLQFRLKANTIRKMASGPFKGKRVFVGRDKAALLDWLWRKGEAHGFEPVFEKQGKEEWDPHWRIETGLLRAWREKNGEEKEDMSFAFATFDGVLRVKDPKPFMDAVRSGIGPGKAFGFGLLSLARAAP